MSRIADLVEKTKRHIENYKKQDNFADVTQVREGIDAEGLNYLALAGYRCNSSPRGH